MFDPLLFLKTVPNQPGVYCMHNAREQVIYVGKAKDLQKRLASYFRGRGHSLKTQTLVAAIATINITVTHTETEALLLEQTYIKQYQPRYNVLLRNDASYPYLLLTKERHPRLVYHRGAQRIPGEYFGPFVNAKALHETLTFLQRVFCLRQCENSVYRHRSRPCLQYQIGRCLGPCVTGLVTDVAYQQQVEHVRLFLQGKNQQVITALVKQMESASQALQFERSAQIRDQIQAIRKIIEKQHVAGKPDIQLDAISIAYEAGIAAVQVLFLRHGHLMGSQTYFPRVPPQTPLEEIVQTFISQFYLQSNAIHSCTARELPASILVDLPLPDGQSLAASLSEIAGHTVKIQNQPRGERAHYLKLAHTNALNALNTKLTHQSMIRNRLHLLSKLLAVPTIHRLECFDISHTLGQQTVAACVVFNANGPLKADYRRYNVTDITPGDDCAAIAYVLKRRYAKPLQPEKIPQVIIIDGGKGQLNAAIKVFKTLNIAWNQEPPLLLSIAKGPQRKAGAETLFLTPTGHGIKLPAESAALHLIQHLRDEAHRYAIIGHRQRRNKAKTTSILQQITGIGPKRRQALLKYMGGLKPLLTATVEQIANVPTISQKLAEKIYVTLRQG